MMKITTYLTLLYLISLAYVSLIAQEKNTDFIDAIDVAIRDQESERHSLRDDLKAQYAKSEADVFSSVVTCIEKAVFEPMVTTLKDIKSVFGENAIVRMDDSTIVVPLKHNTAVAAHDLENYKFPQISASSRCWFLVCNVDERDDKVSQLSLVFALLSDLKKHYGSNQPQ